MSAILEIEGGSIVRSKDLDLIAWCLLLILVQSLIWCSFIRAVWFYVGGGRRKAEVSRPTLLLLWPIFAQVVVTIGGFVVVFAMVFHLCFVSVG